MGPAWNTKYGPRRVRHDPPTLAEAIAAARDLTDQLDEQAEIAASLMGVPRGQVMDELAKMAPQAKTASKTASTIAFTGRAGVQRAVIVERKPSRRVATTPARKLNSAG